MRGSWIGTSTEMNLTPQPSDCSYAVGLRIGHFKKYKLIFIKEKSKLPYMALGSHRQGSIIVDLLNKPKKINLSSALSWETIFNLKAIIIHGSGNQKRMILEHVVDNHWCLINLRNWWENKLSKLWAVHKIQEEGEGLQICSSGDYE